MKVRIIVWALLLGTGWSPSALMAQEPHIVNPPPFEQWRTPVSSSLRFLASEPGRQFLRRSPHPKARELLQWLGEDVSALSTPAPAESTLGALSDGEAVSPQAAGTVTGCGAASGTRFNLEPRSNARPQNTESVDVLRNWVATGVDLVVGGTTDFRGFVGLLGGSATGYAVSRDADCPPEFEGGLPPIADPFDPGDVLMGMGEPTVVADPVRGAVFMADQRFDATTTAIGVFRTTAATLVSATACPSGTHSAAQAATCWPSAILAFSYPSGDPEPDILAFSHPHLAVDERASGTGAGDVYLAVVPRGQAEFIPIWLVACTNTLSACSAPARIGALDDVEDKSFPHLAIRPDGGITVTYLAEPFATGTTLIRYARCTPAGAPNPPTCEPPGLVHDEPQPFSRVVAQEFPLPTRPRHDHRVDANGTETYVVWHRCKVALLENGVCPDADVVMKASATNGATWSALTCLSCAANDQFMPAIRTDHSRNIVNVVYYGSSGDSTFQHRLQVFIRHINPGGVTPDPTDLHDVTTLLNDPSGDPLVGSTDVGDYIGIAARGTGAAGGSRAYVHYTYNNVQGTYNGVQVPEQNNHLSRLDY
jgi:hypothetical protein